MRSTYQVWAPPLTWGPYIEIAHLFGQRTYEVSFNTISQAPSSFEVEIVYWQGDLLKHDIVVGAGFHRFTMGACVCVAKMRAKSHSLGQIIEVNIDGV